MTTLLRDNYQRQIDYMRISITDRCDLNCIYCTASRFQNQAHSEVLRYEEIEKIVQAAALLGVKSIRLTGGEPLVRPQVSNLVKMLAGVPGIEEISMTTNATQLEKQARDLKEAGLKRVNISLDTFIPTRFADITGSDKLDKVLAGIEVAKKAGLNPVKINVVVMRSVNDDEIVDFARKSATGGWDIRFIEEMPLTDKENAQKMVSIHEIRTRIENELGVLEPCWPANGHGPAKYYRLPGSTGTIGFIGPVTDCFCEHCNRFRLTADGKLRPCLLRDDEIDLREPLRGASTAEIMALMLQAAALKKERHELNGKIGAFDRQMWQIGG
jgi:cyclic pyranopterin phosphate synthase